MLFGEAFFAGSETAFTSLLRRKESPGHLPNNIMKWLDNPSELLSVTLIGTNVCVILCSSVSTALFVDIFGGIGEYYSLIVVSISILIFGEVLPKSRALKSPEEFARTVAAPLGAVGTVLRPFSKITNALSVAIVRMIHLILKPQKLQAYKDLKMISDEGKVDIGVSRKAMISLLFDISSITAFDVMIARTNLPTLTVTDDKACAMALFKKTKLEELPVENESGRIVGIVDIDALDSISDGSVEDVISEPLYFPENVPILGLFSDMFESGVKTAVVIDEYGDITGGITRSSVSRCLMGIEEMESKRSEERFSGSIVLPGSTTIHKLEMTIGEKIPRGPYRTFAGFIEEIAHKIPQKNFNVKWEKWTFVIIERSDRSIESVRILK